jgi:hypothetical protein
MNTTIATMQTAARPTSRMAVRRDLSFDHQQRDDRPDRSRRDSRRRQQVHILELKYKRDRSDRDREESEDGDPAAGHGRIVSAVSSQIVNGPSLTSSTAISAPKRPVATSTPRSRSDAANRS